MVPGSTHGYATTVTIANSVIIKRFARGLSRSVSRGRANLAATIAAPEIVDVSLCGPRVSSAGECTNKAHIQLNRAPPPASAVKTKTQWEECEWSAIDGPNSSLILAAPPPNPIDFPSYHKSRAALVKLSGTRRPPRHPNRRAVFNQKLSREKQM